MRPIRLELEGFLSWRDRTAIDLADVSAAAIVGENGAGKTSLVEAIGWALYGKGRGRGPDEFIAADRLAVTVRFSFLLDDQPYRVTRGRERGARTYLELALSAPPGEEWLPAGGDSIAETQAAIEELLGMSYDTWIATAYIGQGRADTFTRARPAERKALLAEVLEIDQYAELAERAHGRVRQHEGELLELGRRTEEVRARIAEAGDVEARLQAAQELRAGLTAEADQVAAELEAARELHRQAEATAAEREQILREIDVLQGERARRQAEVRERLAEEEVRAGALELQRAELQAIADSLSLQADQVAPVDELEARVTELAERIQTAQVTTEAHAATAAAREADENRLKRAAGEALHQRAELTHAGATCPTCGQPVDAEAIARLIAALERQAEEATREAAEALAERGAIARRRQELDAEIRNDQLLRRDAEQKLRGAREVRAAAEVARGQLPQIQRQVADLMNEQRLTRNRVEAQEEVAWISADPSERERALTGRLEQLAGASGGLEALERIGALERRTREIEDRAAEAARDLGSAQEVLRMAEEATRSLDEAERHTGTVQRFLGVLQALEEAFGRDGIPALLIESAVPAIEAEANDLLGKLTAGRFTVALRSQRASRSGDLHETLDIVVGDDVAERPLEALSGGERQCVDLALRIALARTIAHRAGRRIETLVVDEGFTALDATHRQRTIEILHGLLEEFPTVLFVTHLTELADAFPTRIRVQRGDEGSVLEQERS